MLTKEKVKEQMKNLPESFSLDELLEHFILMEKIEKGNLQSIEGKTISDTDMDLKMTEWFK